MSNKSAVQRNIKQYKDEILESVMDVMSGHTYQDTPNDGLIYNNASAANKESQISRFNNTPESLPDFKKFVDGIQNVLQTYAVDNQSQSSGLDTNYNTLLNNEITLTRKESEVLYYLSLNKSIKDIAAVETILENKSVSASTINAIIDKQLYPKFKVDNVEQLVEKASALNLILF